MTRTRVQQSGIESGAVVLPNDARLTDARTPTAHKASHATGGTDAIAPADIGAAPTSHTHTASQISDSTVAGRTLITAANAAAQLTAIGAAASSHTHAAGDVTTGTFAIGRIPTGQTSSTVCIGNDSRLSDNRNPLSHNHGNITNGGNLGTTANLPLITSTGGFIIAGSFGSTANTFCQGNDSRLSNARTPTAHTHPAAEISDSTADGRAILTGSNVYACRAWVNFSGTTSTQSGTYTQSGTTVTVTLTGHGFSVGNLVLLDFTSGNTTDQSVFVSSVSNANTFTATVTNSGTFSGGVNVTKQAIQGSGNVSSVTRATTGYFYVNFATSAPNANYAAVGSCAHQAGVVFDTGVTIEELSTGSAQIFTYGASNSRFDPPRVCVAFFW